VEGRSINSFGRTLAKRAAACCECGGNGFPLSLGMLRRNVSEPYPYAAATTREALLLFLARLSGSLSRIERRISWRQRPSSHLVERRVRWVVVSLHNSCRGCGGQELGFDGNRKTRNILRLRTILLRYLVLPYRCVVYSAEDQSPLRKDEGFYAEHLRKPGLTTIAWLNFGSERRRGGRPGSLCTGFGRQLVGKPAADAC
jgi:hypothetical protein